MNEVEVNEVSVHSGHSTPLAMRSDSAKCAADSHTHTRIPQWDSPSNLFYVLPGVILGILPNSNASSPKTLEDLASRRLRAYRRAFWPCGC